MEEKELRNRKKSIIFNSIVITMGVFFLIGMFLPFMLRESLEDSETMTVVFNFIEFMQFVFMTPQNNTADFQQACVFLCILTILVILGITCAILRLTLKKKWINWLSVVDCALTFVFLIAFCISILLGSVSMTNWSENEYVKFSPQLSVGIVFFSGLFLLIANICSTVYSFKHLGKVETIQDEKYIKRLMKIHYILKIFTLVCGIIALLMNLGAIISLTGSLLHRTEILSNEHVLSVEYDLRNFITFVFTSKSPYISCFKIGCIIMIAMIVFLTLNAVFSTLKLISNRKVFDYISIAIAMILVALTVALLINMNMGREQMRLAGNWESTTYIFMAGFYCFYNFTLFSCLFTLGTSVIKLCNKTNQKKINI